GHEVGRSLLEADQLDTVRGYLAEATERGVEVVLPVDVVAATEFSADADHDVYPADGIPADRMGLDIGPRSGELFASMAQVDMLHVPYKGSGPAMTDLVGGQVQTMIETAPAAQAHIKAGKLRALATTTEQPVPTLPGVPTASEAGLDGFEVSSMFGIVAPAGTPEPVIARLSEALKRILAMPDVRESLLAQGAIATWTTPDDAAAAIRTEFARWSKLIRDADIKVE
ncbi:MAG: phosphoglycerate kinase, partial [Gammaproteobacteria bacterium]